MFQYSHPEKGSRAATPIPIGGQIQLVDELSLATIDDIIAQESRFGFVSVDEIDRVVASSGVVIRCYSIDKPIPAAKLERLIAHNDDVLAGRGKKQRQEAGIAASERTRQFLQDTQRGDEIRNYDVEILEDRTDHKDTSPQIAEKIKVVSERSEATDSARRRVRR